MMEKNVGGLDRTGRIVIGVIAGIAGLAALAGYWTAGAVVGAIGVVIAAILLSTGIAQKCPLNVVAGIDTTK